VTTLTDFLVFLYENMKKKLRWLEIENLKEITAITVQSTCELMISSDTDLNASAESSL
jgi:hypothetical protein